MQDSTLLKIAIACSIIGIITLYLLSDMIDPVSLNDQNAEAGDEILLVGRIGGIRNNGDATFLKVKGETMFDVVVFGSADLALGQQVRLTGTLEEYNGKKEIIAEEISIIS